MLSVGLVGLPNAGKSTLFNLLTKRLVPAENFPFCTIDPHTGIVEVPDARLEVLARMYNTKKQISAAIEFRDIAGLVRGASGGAGLGNEFLSHIRETDMILLVVRTFENPDIIHVEDRVNPVEDEEILNLELILADQRVVEKHILNMEKELKKGEKGANTKMEILHRIREAFANNAGASSVLSEWDTEQEILRWRKSLNLLTDKPVFRLANIIEGGINLSYPAGLSLDILQEWELDQMTPADRIEFTGSSRTGLDKLIVECYKRLGLTTYLTAGEKEVRAWTFAQGIKAPAAAAVIHSDFEKNFIRGEVIKYTDLAAAGSEKAAREAGKIQLVGKDYVVQDGDVCEWIIR